MDSIRVQANIMNALALLAHSSFLSRWLHVTQRWPPGFSQLDALSEAQRAFIFRAPYPIRCKNGVRQLDIIFRRLWSTPKTAQKDSVLTAPIPLSRGSGRFQVSWFPWVAWASPHFRSTGTTACFWARHAREEISVLIFRMTSRLRFSLRGQRLQRLP